MCLYGSHDSAHGHRVAGSGTHERPATSNGHTWKEPTSQPHIPNGVAPQTVGYLAVMPGGQQRVVQLPMTAVQVPAGRMHEFFQLPYPPYMVPNGPGLRVSAPAMPPYSEAPPPPFVALSLHGSSLSRLNLAVLDDLAPPHLLVAPAMGGGVARVKEVGWVARVKEVGWI